MNYLTSVNKDSSRPSADMLEADIKAMANGDKSSLSRLYSATYTPLYGYILSFLKNTYDTEDVLHDCYVCIFKSAKHYKPSGKPLAWIFAIARNLSLKKLGEKKRTESLPEDWDKLISSSDMTIDEAYAIRMCLTKLSDDEREIVVLHIAGGLKHKEIADMMSLALGTVLSKYSRALKKLKTIYEGRIDDEKH